MSDKTVDKEEVSRFANLADIWWNEDKEWKALHSMNPVRVGYIADKTMELLSANSQLDSNYPLAGLKVLDAGCGGGILSEALYQQQADVTGIDVTKELIAVAKARAEQQDYHIDYQNVSLSDMDAKYNGYFDVLCSLEVLEHVNDVSGFVASCAEKLRPGGLAFFSTINQTLKSKLLAIYAAEYVLSLAPKGTHSWNKFIKPSMLKQIGDNANLKLMSMSGMGYNPVLNKWRLTNNLDVNYIVVMQKQA